MFATHCQGQVTVGGDSTADGQVIASASAGPV